MTYSRGRKPTDADYGLGEHSLDGDRLGLLDESELTERLLQTFASPSYRPPRLPAVALELLELSRRPEVEFKTIEALLERDSMLAGEILTIGRSACYSGSRPVTTLGAALTRIGLSKLRDVVMQAALNVRVFRSPTYAECMARLQRHSMAIAHLCRILSNYTPVSADRAFLCGLLHDVGIAGILLVLGDRKKDGATPDLAVLWPAIDAAHARAGASMVALWQLPAEIGAVVAAHHRGRVDDAENAMAATVCVAESLACELNLGLGLAENEAVDATLERLGLDLHRRLDRSDDTVVLRASQSLQLTEQSMDLVRAATRQWVAEAAV